MTVASIVFRYALGYITPRELLGTLSAGQLVGSILAVKVAIADIRIVNTWP